MKSLALTGVLFVLLGAGVVSVWAAQPAAKADTEAAKVTRDRESTATKFASEHHPELDELLRVLKQRDQRRYEVAINELFQTTERLTRLQTRSPDRHEIELDIWKLDSRIRLLTAQSVSGMPEERRAELKRMLLTRQDLKIRQSQTERARLAARVEKLDASIADLQKNGEEQAEKELERLLKSVKGKTVSRTGSK